MPVMTNQRCSDHSILSFVFMMTITDGLPCCETLTTNESLIGKCFWSCQERDVETIFGT